jgi:hypothetical protein
MALNPYCERLEAANARDLEEAHTRTRALVDIADALQRIAAALEEPAPSKRKIALGKQALKLLKTG